MNPTKAGLQKDGSRNIFQNSFNMINEVNTHTLATDNPVGCHEFTSYPFKYVQKLIEERLVMRHKRNETIRGFQETQEW